MQRASAPLARVVLVRVGVGVVRVGVHVVLIGIGIPGAALIGLGTAACGDVVVVEAGQSSSSLDWGREGYSVLRYARKAQVANAAVAALAATSSPR